jgi:hypothetical protein
VDWAATGRYRFCAVMVGAFATLVRLAMVGVSASRVLGAITSGVLRLVVDDAGRVVAAGAAIGLVLSASAA